MVNDKSQRLIVAAAGYLGGVWGVLTLPTEMPWRTAADETMRWQLYLVLTSAYLIGCAVLMIAPLAFPNRKPSAESDTAQRKNERV